MRYEGLHHVQLAMPPGQEATARLFFVDVLSLAEIDKPAVLAARGGAWFRCGVWSCTSVWNKTSGPPARAIPRSWSPISTRRSSVSTTQGNQCRSTPTSPAFTVSTPTTRSATGWSSCNRSCGGRPIRLR